MSLSAVAVVEVANSADRDRLKALVAPSAEFNLGAGDVGRPLGVGVDGAVALAREMAADSYRFLGWDYMDQPTRQCTPEKVSVEFVNTRGKRLSQVEFTFVGGLLTSATGWSRSFEAGSLKAATKAAN